MTPPSPLPLISNPPQPPSPRLGEGGWLLTRAGGDVLFTRGGGRGSFINGVWGLGVCVDCATTIGKTRVLDDSGVGGPPTRPHLSWSPVGSFETQADKNTALQRRCGGTWVTRHALGRPNVPTFRSPVALYGARWCSPCAVPGPSRNRPKTFGYFFVPQGGPQVHPAPSQRAAGTHRG